VVDKLLTPKEVADILQIKLVTVTTYLRNGSLKGVKVGRLWRIRSTDLESFLSRGSTKAVGSTSGFDTPSGL
jgi:excisionase family DNA binding protein